MNTCIAYWVFDYDTCITMVQSLLAPLCASAVFRCGHHCSSPSLTRRNDVFQSASCFASPRPELHHSNASATNVWLVCGVITPFSCLVCAEASVARTAWLEVQTSSRHSSLQPPKAQLTTHFYSQSPCECAHDPIFNAGESLARTLFQRSKNPNNGQLASTDKRTNAFRDLMIAS